MLLSTQSQVIAATRQWCDRQSAAVAGLSGLDPDASGHVIAALIDDLCTNHRPLAFAWAECQMLSARHPAWLPAASEWRLVWTEFWQKVAPALGLADNAEVTRMFFNGETSLHRIRWQAPLDRAALSETCVSWMRLLHTGRTGPMPLRDHARAQAIETPAPALLEGTIERTIADAAADLIGQAGAGAITHRAVARASGANLGSVTHHFPTSNALMSAAFERIYARVTQEGAMDIQEVSHMSGQAFVESMVYYSLASDRSGMLAIDELTAAAGRDAGLAAFGGILRYTRGKSSLRLLSRLTSDPASDQGPLGQGEAALFSAWIQGMGRDTLSVGPNERPRAVEPCVRRMLDIIGVRD
ncbi:MAG: TetR family transcriptional regulator [Asticcacaulis sp.]